MLQYVGHRHASQCVGHAPRLETPEVGDVVDDGEENLLTALDAREHVALAPRGAFRVVLEKLDVSRDRLQRCPELVVDPRKKLQPVVGALLGDAAAAIGFRAQPGVVQR